MKLYKIKCSDGQRDDFAKMIKMTESKLPEFKLTAFHKYGIGWRGVFRLDKYNHIYFIDINMWENKDYINPMDFNSKGYYLVEILEDGKGRSKDFGTYKDALKWTIDNAKKIVKGEY